MAEQITFRGKNSDGGYHACVHKDGKPYCSCGRPLERLNETTWRCPAGYPQYNLDEGDWCLDKFGEMMLKDKSHDPEEEKKNNQNNEPRKKRQ